MTQPKEHVSASTTSCTHSLSEEAALTILLHAAKYPSCTVCGVLLGKAAGGGVAVSTALPLFHLSMLLAPCVETALTQAEALAQARGVSLIGYYHAEARLDAQDMHPVGRRIADRIAARQPDAFALLLDNTKLAAFSRQGSSEPPLELLLRDGSGGGGKGGGWKKVAGGAGSAGGPSLGLSPGGSSSWEGLRARFLNLHAKGVHAQLADFDEHLDDVAADFTNEQLFSADTGLLAR